MAALQLQTLFFPSLHLHISNPKSLLLPPLSLRRRSLFLSVSAFSTSAVYNGDASRQQSARLFPASRDAGRLYVGNLPFSTTPAEIAEIFAQAGAVESVEVVCDRFTERSRGFAFVTMGSVDEANEAIRMFDGFQIGGRAMKVNFPEVPKVGEKELLGPRTRGASRGYSDSPFKVYAGNLGWNLTSQGLHDTFASQPGLLGAKIIYDRDTGRSRGFGFVSFASHEECQAAIEALNGVEIEGRPMRLSIAEGKSAAALSPEYSNSNLL